MTETQPKEPPSPASRDSQHTESGLSAPLAGRPSTPVLALLGLTTVVVLAVATWLAVLVAGARSTSEEGTAAVQAARQVVVNLMTLDHTDAKGSLDRVLAGSTGEFHQQFSTQAGAIQSVLDQARVTSSGDITDAGLSRVDDRTATVLVAAEASVKNVESPQAQPRQYRMSVTLQRAPDSPAGWLVSNVEFVP